MIANNGIKKKKEGKPDPKAMYIGSYNLFEVGSIVESAHIGSFNILEAKCNNHIETII